MHRNRTLDVFLLHSINQSVLCTALVYIPPVFVVIPVVHKSFSFHGMGHLLQQYPIVTVNNSLSLLLHLNLL